MFRIVKYSGIVESDHFSESCDMEIVDLDHDSVDIFKSRI